MRALNRILCYIAMGLAGLLGLCFLLDLALGFPFSRFSIATDIFVLIAAALILWQGWETKTQLR